MSDTSEDSEAIEVSETRSAAPDVGRSRPAAAFGIASLKVPPHSIEAEQSVLGGLMLNNDAWLTVSDVLTNRDFYRAQHQIVFEAMANLANANEPLDAVTLSEALSSRGLLEKAGGIGFLAELAESTPGASNVLAYAQIVRERSTLRQLIAAANKIAESAFQPQGRPSSELLDMAESEVFRIHEGRLRDEGPVRRRAAARARGRTHRSTVFVAQSDHRARDRVRGSR